MAGRVIADNTGAVTLTFGQGAATNWGAKKIHHTDDTALVADDLESGGIYMFRYNEGLDSGAQDQAPANEDLSELQEAWKELENARERLNERSNELHERHMTQGKSISN